MRILHVLDHSIPLHSGYTFRTLSILQQQRALGWETFHVTSPKQGYCVQLEEEVDGFLFYRTQMLNGALSKAAGFSEIALMQALTKRIEEVALRVKPDILHAHSPVLNAIPILRVGRRLGLPTVYEVRAFWEDAAVDHGTSKEGGLRYRLTRGLETYALKHADAITTICDGLRGDIVGRGIAENKVTVIPNAVNIEKFSTDGPIDETLQEKLGLKGAVVLGFIGSFYAYEGLPVLLRALPFILKRIPNARILLVGGGPQEALLKQLINDLQISDYVTVVGRVPHNEVPHYYNLIDILVYPRLSMRLTDLVTPLKPLEAMAQGRLLAASDVGGHRELIRDGQTGVLFRANDAQDLADKVVSLMVGAERWPAIKTAARQYVESERNWPLSVSRYIDVYSKVLNKGAV